MAPRGCWGAWFLLQQGFSGLNPHLRTGILAETWRAFGILPFLETSLGLHQVSKGIYNLKVPGDSKNTTQLHKEKQPKQWRFLLVKHIKKKDAPSLDPFTGDINLQTAEFPISRQYFAQDATYWQWL